MQISEYLDAARARQKLPSDNRLSVALGVNQSASSLFRRGKILPSDETMIRLAELAGIDPARALIDLNLARSKSASVSRVYSSLLQRIAVAVTAFALVMGSSYSVQARSKTEQRAPNTVSTVYYQKWRRYPWRQLLSILRVRSIYLLTA